MSDRNFSRRRRGMRFRPKGGLGQTPQKPDREAIQARAEVVSEQGGAERVFEKRHAQEIERAENIAAGLPPEGAPEPEPPPAPDKKDFREPHARHARASGGGKAFEPVAIAGTAQGRPGRHQNRRHQPRQKGPAADQPGKEDPQGSHHQRRVARNARRRARRRQARGIQHRAHHRGTPGRQHLQRQGPQPRRRPQSRVRGHRLREERLPALLGHRAEPVRQRRGNRRARRPPARPAQDHAEGHPAPLSAGQRNHRAGHQGPDRHQRPARHHQPRAAGPLPRAAAELRSERHLAQD